MDTFQSWVLPWLVVAAILAVLFIVYRAQDKTSAVWVQKAAFRIRLLGKWFFVLICFAFFFSVIVPLAVQEGAMWLAPESKFGYAAKYELADDKVFVQSKPHDCEWGKAPIGSKYCHFEKIVLTDKNEHGKVTAVYVNWEKVQD